MKMEFNYYWGILGFLGLMGYVLENPIYYVFFGFFLLFLVPLFNQNKASDKKDEKWLDSYNWYNVSIWLGSAALMISGLIMMATHAMSDLVSVMLLLGIMAFVSNFFTYVGMDKKAQDERLRKIGTYATTYSWYITLVFVSFLVLTMYWGQNIHNPIELMGLTIFVMTSTMLVANTILGRKGDID
jgi:archaellum biogenesis protein FlaJ (TadC family)